MEMNPFRLPFYHRRTRRVVSSSPSRTRRWIRDGLAVGNSISLDVNNDVSVG
jgi:hypothetical protein